MTQFEVDRMKAAFEYLEDQELYRLEEIKHSDNPDAVKRAQKRTENNVRLLDLVQRTLSEFGVFDVSDPVLSEKLFNDPENDSHVFRFRVQWSGFSESEGMDWDEEETAVQTGRNAEEAEHYLRSHYEFNHCADKTFRNLKLELLCQLR